MPPAGSGCKVTCAATLRALEIGIDESKAQEITAYLRPNPDLTVATDGTQLSRYQGVWRPFSGTQVQTAGSYLHERQHKRELRQESAQKGTAVAISQMADQERTLLFNLRNAFVQTLQQKAVLALARDNLSYYDRLLGINRDRFNAGLKVPDSEARNQKWQKDYFRGSGRFGAPPPDHRTKLRVKEFVRRD